MEIKATLNHLTDDLFEITTAPSNLKLYIDKAHQEHEAKGPNSLELFLSSVAGCTGVFAKRYLERHAIDFSTLTIEARADFIQEAPLRLGNISLKIATDADLKGKDDVFMRFAGNCPIHNTLHVAQEVALTLEK